MKRLFYLSVLLLLGAVRSMAQQVYFSENFDNMNAGNIGYPWTQTYPNYPWQVAEPYLIGVSGCINIPGTDGHNKVAGFSDCSLLGNGNNNNVLLKTPVINVTNTAHVFMQYDSYFVKNAVGNDTESATVEVSLDSGLTWTIASSVNRVPDYYSFQTLYLDLSAFAGHRIMIGFRYSDGNAAMNMPGWAIDNIKVYKPAQKDIAVMHVLPEDSLFSYRKVNDSIYLQGTVMNAGLDTITDFVLTYRDGSGPTLSTTISGLHLATFDTMRFQHPTPYHIPGLGNHVLSLQAIIAGDGNAANDGKDVTIRGSAFMPDKVLAVEQNTGTWNKYGPLGIYLFQQLLATDYPVNLITVHGADPMDDAPYDSWINTLGANTLSYQANIFIDRRKKIIPARLMETFLSQINYFGFAKLLMRVTDLSPGSMTLETSVVSAVDLPGDYRLAIVVTENKVSGNDTTWSQANWFSNTGLPVGGFETKPNPVPYTDMKYDFVARTIFPSAQGGQYSIPVPLYAGDSFATQFTVPLNTSWNARNMEVTLLLINYNNNVVMNSYRLKTYDLLGVQGLAANSIHASLYPNPPNGDAHLSLGLDKKAQVGMTLTDIAGRTVWQQSPRSMDAGNHMENINSHSLPDGMYLLHIRAGDEQQTLKLVVLH